MPSPEISRELEELIIRRLAETANRNKVIEELCLEHGLVWSDADQIIGQLTQSHNLDITRRQSPFLLLLALSSFIGGVFLVAWNLLGIYNYFWPYLDPNTPDALGLYLFSSDAFQILLNMSYATPLFIIGLAMIVGSCFGLKDVWVSFFEWLDQQQLPSLSVGDGQPIQSAALEGNPGQKPQAYQFTNAIAAHDFVPSEEVLDYIFDHLEKGQNEAEVVDELWFKFGVLKPQGVRLVRQVLAASGTKFSGKVTKVSIFIASAALFVGMVWVLQFIFLLAGYLSEISRPLANSWHLFLWLSDIARYIERFPGMFALFALGLVFLVGGFYGLKDLWALIFLLKRKSS